MCFHHGDSVNFSAALKQGTTTGFSLSRGGGGLWCIAAFFIAVGVSIPVLVVTSSVFVPTGEVWDHLAATVLPRYMINSALLLVGVGIGTFIVGVGTAWLVTMYQFPGRALFEWALILPFAVPAYVLAYTYTGMFEFAGPVTRRPDLPLCAH